MTNRQPTRSGNPLLRLATNTLFGVAAGALVWSLTFVVATHRSGAGEGASIEGLVSMFLFLAPIAAMFSLPAVLMLNLIGDYVDRRVPFLSSRGVGFVVMLGVVGLALAVGEGFIVTRIFTANEGVGDRGAVLTRSILFAAATGGMVAGITVAFRIGGKKG